MRSSVPNPTSTDDQSLRPASGSSALARLAAVLGRDAARRWLMSVRADGADGAGASPTRQPANDDHEPTTA
jgi:hypothetical protein